MQRFDSIPETVDDPFILQGLVYLRGNIERARAWDNAERPVITLIFATPAGIDMIPIPCSQARSELGKLLGDFADNPTVQGFNDAIDYKTIDPLGSYTVIMLKPEGASYDLKIFGGKYSELMSHSQINNLV